MFGSCTAHNAFMAGLAALAVTVAPIASAAVPDSFFVEIWLSGSQPTKPRADDKDPYRYDMQMRYVESDTDDTIGGGIAGFGVFDSGEIVLMHYVDYIPSFAEAYYDRSVYTDKHGFGLSDTPRYILVCAWSEEDESTDRRMFRSYAERDDAGVKTRNHAQQHSTVELRYRPVPTRRAKDKFADRDYCAEIAATGQAPVPYWLPPKRGR